MATASTTTAAAAARSAALDLSSPAALREVLTDLFQGRGSLPALLDAHWANEGAVFQTPFGTFRGKGNMWVNLWGQKKEEERKGGIGCVQLWGFAGGAARCGVLLLHALPVCVTPAPPFPGLSCPGPCLAVCILPRHRPPCPSYHFFHAWSNVFDDRLEILDMCYAGTLPTADLGRGGPGGGGGRGVSCSTSGLVATPHNVPHHAALSWT